MSAATRRAVLAGTSAAILAVGGATVVAAEASAVSPDATLLALCAAYHRHAAERMAEAASDLPGSETRFGAARDREWEAFDAVAAAPAALTDEGRAAKASVALVITGRHLHPCDNFRIEADWEFTRLALAEIALAAGFAPTTPLHLPLPADQHPDAALIRACADFEATDSKIRAIYNGPDLLYDDDAAAAAALPMERQLFALLDTMETLTAQTPLGVVARARLLHTHNGHGHYGWGGEGTTTARVLAYVMRDAMGLDNPGDAIGLLAAPRELVAQPDAELIAAAAEVCSLEADSIHLLRAADLAKSDPGYGGPDHLAAEAALKAGQTAQNAALVRLADMPARSLAGLRAKGDALAAYYGGDIPEDEAPCGALLASLLDDLTGLGVAI